MFIIISRTCTDCGGDIKVMLLENEPTEEQKKETYRGMGICASLYIVKDINVNDLVYVSKEE